MRFSSRFSVSRGHLQGCGTLKNPTQTLKTVETCKTMKQIRTQNHLLRNRKSSHPVVAPAPPRDLDASATTPRQPGLEASAAWPRMYHPIDIKCDTMYRGAGGRNVDIKTRRADAILHTDTVGLELGTASRPHRPPPPAPPPPPDFDIS